MVSWNVQRKSKILHVAAIGYNQNMTQTGEIHPRSSAGSTAPDFTLPDHNGTPFTLSAITMARNALLVFNIGFA